MVKEEDTSPPDPHRRMIIVVAEVGQDVEVEYEGEFAVYEVLAILRRAMEMVEEEDILETIKEQREETDDDGTP